MVAQISDSTDLLTGYEVTSEALDRAFKKAWTNAKIAYLKLVLLAVTCGFLQYFLWFNPPRKVDGYLAPASLAFIAGIYLIIALRRKHTALFIPILLQDLPMKYRPSTFSPHRFSATSLVPDGRIMKATDCIGGSFGGRELEAFELHVATGGKGSRTLFKGVVVELSTKTKGNIWATIVRSSGSPRPPAKRVSIKSRILPNREVFRASSGQAFKVYTEAGVSPDDLFSRKFLQAVFDLDGLSPNMHLVTCVQTPSTMQIALHYKHDLLSVVGLFPTKSRVLASLQKCADEIQIYLNAVEMMLEAQKYLPEAFDETPKMEIA